MKNSQLILKKLTLAIAMSAGTMQLMAQGDAAQLIKAGTTDVNALMNGYMSPLLKSFGAGLNSGWYQTAKPHGIGGFDITVSTNITFAPTEDLTYSLNGLQKMQPANPSETTAPSIFGDKKAGPKVNVVEKSPFTGNDTVLTSFELPQGLGVNLFAVPTAQFSVGVGLGTDISVRFMPKISAGDIGIGLFGFAVKHDFKQWIPGMKDLPFDLSAMFGYTTANADLRFTGASSIQPDGDTNIYNPNPGKKYTNQTAEFKSTAWTTNLIISKKLGPFTPYLGVGYQQANTTLAFLGDYPVTVPNNQADATNPASPSFGKAAVISDISNPVNIEGNISGFRANVGFRLKLAVLTIHGDYTFGQYNVASVGLGLNIQSIAPFKL
jgi:hypothetical protein